MVNEAVESFTRAEACATEEKDLESAAQYSAAMGLLLLSEQRYSEALAAYDRAVSRLPCSEEVWAARGEALCELGRFEEALDSQRKAIDLCSGPDPGLLYNVALTYAGMGDADGCGKALQKALDADRMQVMAIVQNFDGDGELFAQRRQDEAAFLTRRLQEADGDSERRRWQRLKEVVTALRQLEEDPAWLRDRLLDSASGRNQTAYGSTWIESFCHLADAGSLYCTGTAPQQMVVFGSSIGWQCFLGHLHLGYAPCRGFEILASQVQAAQRLAEELGLEDGVEFRCQDALEADVSEAGLVWLNTYAWPAEVKQRVAQKLLQELPEGSQVVSYEPIPTAGLCWQGRHLRLKASVNLEASWDPELTAEVHVFTLRTVYLVQMKKTAHIWPPKPHKTLPRP
ncbi:Ogt [Symbiodinium natans]|uniref:Ogt protein n=1 Tax=Symbiodinium natans TaxID=878477 RepID=A0A812NVS0_9DINO|nr:Ogt [Symbiodinium natans]